MIKLMVVRSSIISPHLIQESALLKGEINEWGTSKRDGRFLGEHESKMIIRRVGPHCDGPPRHFVKHQAFATEKQGHPIHFIPKSMINLGGSKKADEDGNPMINGPTRSSVVPSFLGRPASRSVYWARDTWCQSHHLH